MKTGRFHQTEQRDGYSRDTRLRQAAEEKCGTVYSFCLNFLFNYCFVLIKSRIAQIQPAITQKLLIHLFLLYLCVSLSQSCTLLVSLLPFFLSSALYFYLLTPDSAPSVMSAGVKCAPALLLAAVVLSWNGGQSVLGVAGGLVFSAIGDCCLVWPELFIHGKELFLHN